MKCPDPIQLEAFVDGELPAERLAEVASHLKGCPACAAQVRRTKQLVTLLHRQLDAVEQSFDPAAVLTAVREETRRHRAIRTVWRRSAVAAALMLAFGAGATAYQVGLWQNSTAPSDRFAQALFGVHDRYETVLAADRSLNVQVAVLEQ